VKKIFVVEDEAIVALEIKDRLRTLGSAKSTGIDSSRKGAPAITWSRA